MATPAIPAFEATSIDAIPATASLVRTTFLTQKTKPIAYRLAQLRKLYWSLEDNTPLLLEAIKRDLNKSYFEAMTAEIGFLKSDIILFSDNLQKWARDGPAPNTSLMDKFVHPRIRKEPMGTVLVIGCWNFPYRLTMGPFIGAIAAGCTAVLKPSEVGPNTAMAMTKVIEDALDPDAYAVINGGVEETTVLLNEKWAKITYTGNAMVGRIVMMKAAETLTPVTLELGGLNPAIVTKNANIHNAAQRLLWGKHLNAGQVCLSHNYVLVDREVFPAFVEETKKAVQKFYPQGPKASPDFGRIINKRHFHRIKKMLDDSKGKILLGGDMDEEQLYIAPTLIQVDSIEDTLIKEESFGPLVPIIPFSTIEEAIQLARSVHATPLAFFPFGTKTEVERLLQEVQSGGASINDSYFHGSIHTLAFGGVGQSGTGSWHGRASYDNFTHLRSITTTANWMERLVSIRYPPYAPNIPLMEKALLPSKPNFDRQGRRIRGLWGWILFVLGLGGESSKVSLQRWVAVLVFAVAAKKVGDFRTRW